MASTVVLLRALQERRLIDTERGRIAVGWLIVEDLAMVLALVLLPALAGLLGGGGSDAAGPRGRQRRIWSASLGITLAKVAAFVALMLVVGRRVIPWMLHYVAHTGSRELFRLAVLAIALGVAFGAAKLFGVSFALGAFFAGMILSESRTQPPRRGGIAAAARRLRGAVLRLGRHAVRSDHPAPRAAGRAGDACSSSSSASRWPRFLIVLAVRLPARHRADDLGEPGADRRVLLHPGRARRRPWPAAGAGPRPDPGRRDPVDPAQSADLRGCRPAAAALERTPRTSVRRQRRRRGRSAGRRRRRPMPTKLADHTILVGYGRVGSLVGAALTKARHARSWSSRMRDKPLARLRSEGVETIVRQRRRCDVFAAANRLRRPRLILAVPNAFEAGQVDCAGAGGQPRHQDRAAGPFRRRSRAS